MDRWIIHADGTAHRPGCAPEKWTVLDLSPRALTIHTPATGYHNRGWNPCPASIDVYPIERMTPLENGSLSIKVTRSIASFHPTGKIAREAALKDIARLWADQQRAAYTQP